AEGIGGVDLDLGIPVTDREVLDHHRLASLVGEAIPDALFPHWIDEEVPAAGGLQASTASLLIGVLMLAEIRRSPHHGQERVRHRQVRPEFGTAPLRLGPLNLFDPFGSLPDEQIAIAAQADRA